MLIYKYPSENVFKKYHIFLFGNFAGRVSADNQGIKKFQNF